MSEKEFFNSIAEEWDNIIEVNNEKILLLLSKLKIENNDSILDVGTGTGVLIPFLNNLSNYGPINALDISDGMLNKCMEKFNSFKNVTFTLCDIEKEPLNKKYNKIVLYSMFPHLQQKEDTIKKLINNNLNENGLLLIAHSNSREFLNNMHSKKNEAVKKDRLIDVNLQRKGFEEKGLKVLEAVEDHNIYYLLLTKGEKV